MVVFLLLHFGGRRAAPVWGLCDCFALAMGELKRNPFCSFSVPQGNSCVAVVPFPAGPGTTGPLGLATEPGRDQRQVLV